MKNLIFAAVALLSIFLAILVQEFLAPVSVLHGARVVLVPMLFCYAALALPLWLMLPVGFLTGVVSALTGMVIFDNQTELGLGWWVFFYLVFGFICQGVKPVFVQGHWELHAILSALGTAALVGLQFLTITVRRFETSGVIFNAVVLWRVFGSGGLAFLFSPFVHLVVTMVDNRVQAMRGGVKAY